MSTNTYVALDRQLVASNTPSVTFTGISQAYTNLEIVVSGGFVSNNDELGLRFNGDTSTNYSTTFMLGDGGSAVGTRQANATSVNAGRMGSTQLRGISRIVINDYKDPNINKTVISKTGSAIGVNGGTGGYIYNNVSLWRATPQAITSITLFEVGGNNILAGTTVSLYGILAEGSSPAPKATGGAIYSDSLYYYHVFGSTGVFTPSQALSCDVLTVAGGGGGGAYGGGGGGAGGYRLLSTQSLVNGTNYTATVGAGGNAGVYNSSQAVSGSNSSFAGSGFSTITASGGGYGGGYPTGTQSGGSGGSGGGSWVVTGASGNAGGYSPVEGFAGGNGAAGGSFNETSGGGGGAGGVGQNATGGSRGGDGGVGNSATFSTWGFATGVGQNVSGTYYIAGGGGAGQPGNITAGAQAIGGFGGGGTGSTKSGLPSTAGSANTGSGGGAGSYSGTPGTIYTASNGGSGVVIVRYLKA
jgi:hypothetical protein